MASHPFPFVLDLVTISPLQLPHLTVAMAGSVFLPSLILIPVTKILPAVTFGDPRQRPPLTTNSFKYSP